MAILKLSRTKIKLFFEIHSQKRDKLSTKERFERLEIALEERGVKIERDKRIVYPVVFWTECFFDEKDEILIIIRQTAKKQRLKENKQ